MTLGKTGQAENLPGEPAAGRPLAKSKAALLASPGQAGIDPRGPRFGAGITATLLLVVIGLALSGTTPLESVGARLTQPAFILFAIIAALFAVGAFAGVQRHPYGWVYRNTVRRLLPAPTHREDPRPPTFSQGVGFFMTITGIALELLGVPHALVIFASLAFIAAFLNSVFDYCVGCQIYLLLVRLRLVARSATE